MPGDAPCATLRPASGPPPYPWGCHAAAAALQQVIDGVRGLDMDDVRRQIADQQAESQDTP
ncbi:hypothetical protein RYJ27_10685 [Microbacterium limosum]|uniref:Uncharacterized protein n=1 Tax=Microbacterium limosum TaxID=3079935 RepID=A0AAU0MFD9_9MICO|nr:hypothetical protein [Microbacterium sp. Y20]WOQ69157.1 hypothetical protein RYJ27_10685 [Microbacterium sp. Y20]